MSGHRESPRYRPEGRGLIAVETHDAFEGRVTSEADRPSDILNFPYLNPQNGPIWVDGAEKGDGEDAVRENLPFETVSSVGDYENRLCETYLAEPDAQPRDGVEVRYEFCFEDYVLQSKRVIEVEK